MTKRNQPKERKNRKDLYLKYGDLIGLDTKEIPEKHQSGNGGLRCFKRIRPRDRDGNKIKDAKKARCGNTTAKGSLYCRHHGGNNSKALTTGKRRSETLELYKGSYDNKLGDLLQAFMDDPGILDLKTELATTRLVLKNYIEKLASGEPDVSPKKLCRYINNVMNTDEFSQLEKFLAVKEIVDSQSSLTDGASIDRINRTVDSIGKTVERIRKTETKEDFMLTPEGLKVLIRGIVEIINTSVEDRAILDVIKKGLLEVSLNTGGDLSKYGKDIIDAEYSTKD